MLARNVRVGRNEIDLIVTVGGSLVAVEVKTLWPGVPGVDEPADGFTRRKAARVRRAATQLDPPVFRVDLVTVTFDATGAAIRWIPQAA